MFEEKLTRIKKLMEQRDKINAELAELVGMSTQAKRGRPRKEQGDGSSESVSTGHGVSVGMSTSQPTSNRSEAE